MAAVLAVAPLSSSKCCSVQTGRSSRAWLTREKASRASDDESASHPRVIHISGNFFNMGW